MRRFLVVGCGGSGGNTLAYMMDQLRSDLAEFGIDKIPAGWQFVSIDVPTAPERGMDGLDNVRDQGGTYYASGSQGDSYKVLDNALANQLGARRGLDEIATWAPRDPGRVGVPISTGAGQYRALGRMITLSKASGIRETLQRAWDELFTVETAAEMRGLSIPGGGDYDAGESPLVLVVSSMAGGAGASMALDICRLLTLVQGLDPKLMGVFMVAPDIFDGLPSGATTGVRANALAMMGEIISSQMGSAREHDVSILRALGLQNGEGAQVPFARVFPVGRRVGVEGAPFGDGSQSAIYRGLARGLSGMMMSGTATDQFVSYDLTNSGSTAGSRSHVGWGAGRWDDLPWGTYGFSSMSMGRDRYAEYSAQRLAHSSVDKLLDGHLQQGNRASSDEQVNAILDSQWPALLGRMGLGDPAADPRGGRNNVVGWIGTTVLPWSQAAELTAAVVNHGLRPYIPSGDGMNAKQWVPLVYNSVGARRGALQQAARQTANRHAFMWHQRVAASIERVVAEAIAEIGLPYATALVNRLTTHLKNIIGPASADLARMRPADIVASNSETDRTLASLKGTIIQGGPILESVLNGYRQNIQQEIYASLSGEVSAAVDAFVPEILTPLLMALNEAQSILRNARNATTVDVGLARLKSNDYAAWPSDSAERVPPRFAEANNEVMLTPSADFIAQYQVDLPRAVSGDGATAPAFTDAVARAATNAITGIWPTTDGTRAPGEVRALVERVNTWRSKAFVVDPNTGESLIPSAAQYEVHVHPTEILSNTRMFVARTGESFERFCRVSLRDFIAGADAPESELAQRRGLLLSKFEQALSLARPLASVNKQALAALHNNQQIEYHYKFSSVPFKNLPVADEMSQALERNPMITLEAKNGFARLLTDERGLKRVDIFGSYPNYSPLAYDSVVRPASLQWAGSSAAQQQAFWEWRRTRPLAASLPMHDEERRVMAAGWFLGLVLGRVHIPAAPFNEPVRVWDAKLHCWLDFPNPLLTPPSRFGAKNDWLPAVLESVLLAMARSHEPPVMNTMLPYQALRGIYDTSAEDPVSGIAELSAKVGLIEWLRTGTTGTGWESSVKESGPGMSVDERADRAITWLTGVRDFTGAQYMQPGQDGAAGRGAFSDITTREQASQTPIYRDLAPDVFWATGSLIAMVEECRVRANQPDPAVAGMPEFAAGTRTIVVPDAGDF